MTRRDDAKTRALAASRTLNPRPEKVADPAFAPGSFFDPADLVQVKYEMVRRPRPTARRPPGPRRPSGSPASRCIPPERHCRARAGRPDPGKPGPKSGHKLTGEVVSHLEELLAADPRLRPADLAAAAGQRFGITVHPRSVERALQRRREARSACRAARRGRPKSG